MRLVDDETKFNWALVGTRVVSPWDKSETLARTLLRELIAKNHLQAKYTYATSIFAGVIRGDREEAVKLWEDCSRADHSWAKFNLASLLAEGKVDTERAVRLYEEAWNCKPVLSEAHAHTAALNLSTLLYSLGRTNEAASWLIKAADEAHDSLAQYQLAHAYSHGTKGLPLDLEKAKAYNTRAADGGMSLAQHNLGCLFHEASPTPDYEAAAYYFAKAHFQGYYWSTLNLATMYARGRGVPQNFATAHLLLRDVATFGSEDQKKAAKLVQENVNKLENGEEVPEDAPAAKPAGR
jgi:TPR repeat protein